jgi:ribosome-associated protein
LHAQVTDSTEVIISQTNTMDADQRVAESRKFAIEIARLAANTRCSNVVVLDVRGVSPVTDFFVLATGTSARQMRSVTDEAAEYGEEHNFKAIAQSGMEGETWMLVDFVDVVMHVFNGEARAFYDLDSLWGDAPRVGWEQAPSTQTNQG